MDEFPSEQLVFPNFYQWSELPVKLPENLKDCLQQVNWA